MSGAESGGQVIIDVSDDGPGVPPDQLPHIFERFYRGGARSRRPGSGLGLAIAAEIVSAHGGTAYAEPAGPRGLRITLALPVDGRPDDNPDPYAAGRELAATVR